MSADLSLSKRLLSALRGVLTDRRNPAQQVRLQIFNQSSQTMIATDVLVADTGSTRNKGLLGRRGLASGEGMWIVPGEAVHTFCMQFPIDLIYLDRKHKIKKIRSSVSPGRISACLTAHSVLELAPGTILETKVRVGDQLSMTPSTS